MTINPDLPDATVYLGLASVREGDLAAGKSLFRSAINLQPDLAAAHNDLASVLTGQGHYREAEFHLQKAVEINPADPQVRHNYGMFLVRTGSRDKALIELREAALNALRQKHRPVSLTSVSCRSYRHYGIATI